ncbi:SMI1/KNR4 family protein [Streptomyces sp. NPDC059169]|uniref:SMI1/KNR4 family protein n=1 Tax=unclassified Streptomyces TaxID=2593676 RepID=UPI003678A8BB
MRRLVSELMARRVDEHLADPFEASAIPRIYPPASQREVSRLEVTAGQSLDRYYRDFLSVTDGMDGFYLSHCVLGCRNRSGARGTGALQFRDGAREDGTPADVGLPGDVVLFPVSVNRDVSQAIFMIDCPDVLPERIWWLGEGDSMFFGNFADLLGYANDPRSYTPRETVD